MLRGWLLCGIVLISYSVVGNEAGYPSLLGFQAESAYEEKLSASQSCKHNGEVLVALGVYARLKHEYLLANYPNYAAANVDIETFIHQYGADVYLAAAVMYEAFMEEVGEDPDDPYLWQLAMEVFQEELFPILLEFTPGIGDLIGAYNDFQAGSYFWGIVGIVGSMVPGDEVIKVIRKADNIRDAWRKVKKVFVLWNRLFTTAGGQRILNKMPKSWKDLPGSKLAYGQGLYWEKTSNHHLRIMDANPNSPWPSQHVKYVKCHKGNSFIDINGNPVPGNSPAAHIPLDDITDSFLNNFFN